MDGSVTWTSPVVRAVVNGTAAGLADVPAEHVVAGQDVLRGQITYEVIVIETPEGVARDRVSLKDHVATLYLPRVWAQGRKAPTDEVSSVGAHWTDGDPAVRYTPQIRQDLSHGYCLAMDPPVSRSWLWSPHGRPVRRGFPCDREGVARECGLSRPARPPGIPADPKTMSELGRGSKLDDFA